jgi:uncharacterized membrane protein YoaK (UPF0700 family)
MNSPQARPAPSAQAAAMRDWLLIALAATSGYIDAVSYLGLDRVFTANMTGNTVLFGLAVAQGNGLAALRNGLALVGFVLGVAIAAFLLQKKSDTATLWPSSVTAALTVEFIVLAASGIGGIVAGGATAGTPIRILAVLAGAAMGIQSASVRALGVPGVVTTYITGTWTSYVSGLVARLRHLARSGMEPGPTGARPPGVRLQAGVLFVYALGGVLGGAAEIHWLLGGMVVPACVLLGVVVTARMFFPRAEHAATVL